MQQASNTPFSLIFWSRSLKPSLHIRFLILVACLVALPLSAFGQGAKFKGVVQSVQADGQKSPAAGVSVRIAAKAGSKAQETFTDDEGRFTFIDLDPGDYVLTIESPGFETYSKTYQVMSGVATTVGIDIKIAASSDTVVVKAEDPGALMKTETSTVNVLGMQTLRNAPLVSESFQDALPLLPGVVRGPDGLLNLNGARTGQSGLLVNSTNVTDPATGNFAISVPLEAIQSVTVLSSPYSAEYGKFTGAVAAISTRSGGDKFRFLFTNFLPRTRRRIDPNTGKQRTVGLESFTPRIVLSGPIIKGKLTFSQSFQYQFIRTLVPSQRFLRNDTVLETFDSFSQVDYDVNQNNRLTFVFSVFPQNLTAPTLNTFNPLEATPNFRQRGFFTSVVERAAFSNGSLLESTFAFKRFDAFVFPQGNQGFQITPSFNQGNFFNRQDRRTDRIEGQVVYNFPTLSLGGTQALKVGVNVGQNTIDGRDANSAVQVARADGSTSQNIQFVGNGRLDRESLETTVFVQNKYTVNRRLTLDFGVRYDRNGISEQNNFAPRFGFVVVPFDDDATVVRGGVGVFYDKVPLGVATFTQLQNRSITSFDANGVTPLGAPILLANRFGNDLRTPYSVSGSLEVDRRILRRLFFRFGYQQRVGHNEFIVNPENAFSALTLSNGGKSRYRQFEFTTRYRFTDTSDVAFSYVRSKTTGNLNDLNGLFGNFRTPVLRPDQIGRLPFDAPNRFLVTGNIEIPFGVVVSPVLDVRTGFPFSLLDEDQNFVGARNPDNQRFPRFIALDMQITKRLKIPVGKRRIPMRVGLKFFNLTNHFNPRDVQSNVDSPFFGTFFNSVNRTFRGKFEFDF